MTRQALGQLLLAFALVLSGCKSQPRTEVTGATVVGAAVPLAPPAATAPPAPRPAPPPLHPGSRDDVPVATRAEIMPGTGRFMAPPPVREAANGDITLNFTEAPVRDVAKAVLGDMLGLTYVVTPGVDARLTIATGSPIRREQVLPTFEAGLQSAGLALLREGETYRIAPAEAGAARGSGLIGADDPGTGTEAITLRYVSATELKKLLDRMVPAGTEVAADDARNILFVAGNAAGRRTVRDLAAQFDVDWLRGVSFALIVPQWTDGRALVQQLTEALNAEGVPTAGTVRFVPIEQLNGILAIATRADYLERVRRLVAMLDREAEGTRRRLFVYRVQNGRAADLAKVLAAAFGGDKQAAVSNSSAGSAGLATAGATVTAGSLPAPPVMPAIDGSAPLAVDLGDAEGSVAISADETSNSIVVHAKPQQYDIVADALRRLDVLPLQVMIESAVTEVTLNDELRFGVQWFFHTGNSNFSLSELTSGAVGQTFPGFSYLLTNGSTISAALNALSDITSINVVSAPKLLVLNNQTASLQVGDQVPVATQTAQSVDTSDSRVVNSIEYRDTGVILRITPRVNDSGVVLLDISQEVSNVVNTTTSKLDSPTIQQRKVASSVAVEDGQTIALGGLITEDRENGNTGIPVLKDIPLIGRLFGATSRKKNRTELLVLLTPRVVRNAADAKRITDELREKIRSVTPLPIQPETPK
ncbi:type II secretion system secretin GspD [Zavarzinia sp.]|uniref:type II secretion system secretin GspD n=1 Tax=Zavarzinia sp. TaxID=2027920 RepID=UPI00356178C9